MSKLSLTKSKSSSKASLSKNPQTLFPSVEQINGAEPALRSFEAGSISEDGKHGPPRRNWLAKDGLFTTPDVEVKSLSDLLLVAAKKYGNQKCMGSRELVRLVKEEKEITKKIGGKEVKETKTWTYFELSPYKWQTYNEVIEQISQIGSGLTSLGLKKADIITIYSATSQDWTQVAHGAFRQNMTVATAYDTLGEEGLVYSLNETESQTMFTTTDLFPMIKKVMPKCPNLKTIIYGYSNFIERPKAGEKHPVDELKELFPQLTLLSLEVLKAKGKAAPVEMVPAGPEDFACIMYTSGTTGNPKGVLIPHRMVLAAVAGGGYIVQKFTKVEDPTYLAYLPLAHIIAFSAFHMTVWAGLACGFGSPKTLTDMSVRNCKGDIAECRPHIMTGVPAVYDQIRKGILNRIAGSSPIVQALFAKAYDSKWWLMERGLPTFFWDALVFNKIKANLGGRVMWGLAGGAPTSKDTQKFFSVAVAPLIQGWGLTETAGSGTLQMPSTIAQLGMVGEPSPATEIKLVDVDDAGYFVKDKPNPRGEVWLRGANVTPGYYKQPKATAEAFSPDGWFMTGDIGEWLPDGTLKIIDRKKNLVKLARGEYIALEKLESIYRLSLFTQNICVCADSLQNQPVCVVFPAEAKLLATAKEQNLFPNDSDPTLEQLCANPVLNKLVLQSFKDIAKEQGLAPHEVIEAVALVPTEWTAQNGFLTAANKLRRREIGKAYENEIKALYSGSSSA